MIKFIWDSGRSKLVNKLCSGLWKMQFVEHWDKAYL